MLLARYRAIEKPSPLLNDRRESDEEDGFESDVGYVNTKSSGIKGGKGQNKQQDSDDSDFDL